MSQLGDDVDDLRFSGSIPQRARGALSVAALATFHGYLKMDIAYVCAGLDEPVILEMVVRKPKRIFAVCESLAGWTTDGAIGWRAVATADMDRARRLSVEPA
ncbi:hypothetical protein [Brevundimonas sp. GCM10030266]|uniref:hypothetical protein n=1 Tax=Brevundimonas sp. GCM10030266 TaxID=3273386 RepID=UPI00361E7B83